MAAEGVNHLATKDRYRLHTDINAIENHLVRPCSRRDAIAGFPENK